MLALNGCFAPLSGRRAGGRRIPKAVIWREGPLRQRQTLEK
jgi:hypothetical protein